jgi:hypothetical protein
VQNQIETVLPDLGERPYYLYNFKDLKHWATEKQGEMYWYQGKWMTLTDLQLWGIDEATEYELENYPIEDVEQSEGTLSFVNDLSRDRARAIAEYNYLLSRIDDPENEDFDDFESEEDFYDYICVELRRWAIYIQSKDEVFKTLIR